ncbi:MAG: ribonuclease III domain-containing protein [Lachnospiraceae bacterium]|nr:ribonuclease III [Robinsoniella sp.]MDY3766390.1 ribonuclease III domain-containing protein [Lachnospiraceae bacterium]
MEKSVNQLPDLLLEQFQMEKQEMNLYSPLTLAYIGDAVYDLMVRTLVVEHGNCAANKLHRRTSQIVKAPAQAKLIDQIFPMLTEKEQDIYRRGKNAKSYTMAKNATMGEYHKATGLEALMGYLYLNGEMERAVELLKMGLERGKEDEI